MATDDTNEPEAAPETHETHESSWCFGEGLDDEGASITEEGFATREHAIEAGRAYYDDGSKFQTAYKRWSLEHPPSPLSESDVLDDAVDNLEWHEDAVEDWVDDARDHSEDLDTRLDAVWDAWCKDNKLETWMFWLDDVETCEARPVDPVTVAEAATKPFPTVEAP